MGKYKEKVREHFWMLVCRSMGSMKDEHTFKKTFEPIFKINTKETFKLIEDHVWSILYSSISEARNPADLKRELESVIQFDIGKTKNHIWKILLFSASKFRGEEAFRELFEPILRINSKEAYKLGIDRVWSILFSIARKIKEPKELSEKLDPFVEIEVKPAAQMIKEDNPEKYKMLLIYK